MYIFTIQNETIKNKEEFQKDLSKWLQIPENIIKEHLKYNDLSLNVNEHYFNNFFNNFLKDEVNITLEEFKLSLNNENYNKLDTLEQIDVEAMMEKIYDKYKVYIFIMKTIV